jgi:hypothetical protein
MLKTYRSNEGHVFVANDGRVSVIDTLPADLPDNIRTAATCDRDEFISVIISGLVKQLTLLGECLHGIPNDRLLNVVSSFAKETAEDISILKQAAHSERRREEIHGEILRANHREDFSRVEQLRAEQAALPHVQRKGPERLRPMLVQAAEPPVIEAPKPGLISRFFGRN